MWASWLSGKESACSTGDSASIPRSGRSPGEGNGNPLQYSCLENPKDRGAWRATVHGVAKNETQLNEYFAVVQWLVMSDFLHPHELQHVRIPCPSLSPGVCANSCPLSQWYHPTISSSVIPISSCPQSSPASEPFPMSWLFSSDGQSFGASTSASVLPMKIQGWFPLG